MAASVTVIPEWHSTRQCRGRVNMCIVSNMLNANSEEHYTVVNVNVNLYST